MRLRHLPRLRPHRALPATLLFLALSAPSPSRATDYSDPLDAFSLQVDPPGFIACTTYPVDRWDKVDCDGLSREHEALERAALPSDAIVVGSAVYRADAWGFRVRVTRVPWTAPPMNAAEEARFADRLGAAMVKQLAGTKGTRDITGLETRMVTRGDLRAARISFEALGQPSLAVVELGVLGAHATYEVELLGPTAHAAELAAMADRAFQTVQIRPAPRTPPWLPLLTAVLVAMGALAGTVVLVAALASKRSKGRSSAVSWPGTRG